VHITFLLLKGILKAFYNLRFGLRSFLGSKKEYSGNSVINSSIYLGLIIF